MDPAAEKELKHLLQHLDQVRRQKGVSQKALGQKIGKKTGSWVSRVMSGEINISASQLLDLAKALGVHLNFSFTPPAEEQSLPDLIRQIVRQELEARRGEGQDKEIK